MIVIITLLESLTTAEDNVRAVMFLKHIKRLELYFQYTPKMHNY